MVCVLLLNSCKSKVEHTTNVSSHDKSDAPESVAAPIENTNGANILTRFLPPEGYKRDSSSNHTFATYLRNFPLLDAEEKVYLYNGNLKGNQSAHAAILDIDVGDRDLQQCADAIMRLRAEYLWGLKRYEEIAFDFTNGWRFAYSNWRKGDDLVVDGNRTRWQVGSSPKDSYQDFRAYLNKVFMYAGTLSLSKELKPKRLEDINIGDVFIYGGSPGHAVLVVDLAVDERSGDEAFLLAQSYMPAQQIHVLKNPKNDKISPWYLVSEIGNELETPEWTFKKEDIKTF